MYPSPSQIIKQQLKDLKHKVTCGVQFFDTFELFPEIGKECAVYVDKSIGAFYIWNGTTYVTCCGEGGIIGAQGTQGIQGSRGLQGLQGIQGLRGLQGTQGLIGSQGLAGYSGLSYGSFFDVTDQTVTSGQVAAMKFGTTDFSNGITITNDLSSNPTFITLSKSGVHNIQFSAQLYRTNGGSQAHARIWLRKNGTNVPDTNTVVHFGNNNIYSVAAWNFFVQASAGDKYQLMWTQDDGIILSNEPENLVVPYPAVPSVILTVNQIS